MPECMGQFNTFLFFYIPIATLCLTAVVCMKVKYESLERIASLQQYEIVHEEDEESYS